LPRSFLPLGSNGRRRCASCGRAPFAVEKSGLSGDREPQRPEPPLFLLSYGTAEAAPLQSKTIARFRELSLRRHGRVILLHVPLRSVVGKNSWKLEVSLAGMGSFDFGRLRLPFAQDDSVNTPFAQDDGVKRA